VPKISKEPLPPIAVSLLESLSKSLKIFEVATRDGDPGLSAEFRGF
jgi:hypothetical protein